MSWAQMDPTGALSQLHLLSFGKGASLPAQIPLHFAFPTFRDSKLQVYFMTLESSCPLSQHIISKRNPFFFLFSPVYLILIELTSKGIYQLNSNETEIQSVHFCFSFN